MPIRDVDHRAFSRVLDVCASVAAMSETRHHFGLGPFAYLKQNGHDDSLAGRLAI